MISNNDDLAPTLHLQYDPNTHNSASWPVAYRGWGRRSTWRRCTWARRCSSATSSSGRRTGRTWGRSTWTRAAGAGNRTPTGTGALQHYACPSSFRPFLLGTSCANGVCSAHERRCAARKAEKAALCSSAPWWGSTAELRVGALSGCAGACPPYYGSQCRDSSNPRFHGA